MKNRRAGVFIAGLLGAVILVGLLVGLLRQFVSPVTPLSPDPQRHFDLQLTLEDVPNGYVQRSPSREIRCRCCDGVFRTG